MRERRVRLVIVTALLTTGILAILLVITVSKTSPRLQRLLLSPSSRPLIEDFIPPATRTEKKPADIPLVPDLNIAEYRLATSLPEAINARTIFVYKKLQRSDILALAKKLVGKESILHEHEREISAESSDQTSRIVIDPVTGMFAFTAKRGLPILPYVGRSNPAGKVARYLHSLGLIDDTIAATSYYRKTSAPGVVFVEFHRLWDHDTPIINAAGVLNTRTPLASLSLTAFDPDQPADPSIVDSSDEESGKSRNNQFNTLTVALTETGNLLSITSTLRTLAKRQTLEELGLTLLPPEKILAELKGSGSFLSYSQPLKTSDSWKTIYQENRARIRLATITSIALAYEEKPLGVEQEYLQPVYLVRGTAATDNGYTLAFTQTVPAIEDAKSLTLATSALAQEPTQMKSIKIGSFEPTPEGTVSPSELPTGVFAPNQVPSSSRLNLFASGTGCEAVDMASQTVYKSTDSFFVPGIGTLVLFRSVPQIAGRIFLRATTPRLLSEMPAVENAIDGIRISLPCVIMPAV